MGKWQNRRPFLQMHLCSNLFSGVTTHMDMHKIISIHKKYKVFFVLLQFHDSRHHYPRSLLLFNQFSPVQICFRDLLTISDESRLQKRVSIYKSQGRPSPERPIPMS